MTENNQNLTEIIKKDNLWKKAFRKFFRDKMGVTSFAIVCFYGIIALGVVLGLWANEWDLLQTDGRAPVSKEHWFGTNLNGQDVYQRAIFSTKTAFEVGVVVAFLATLLGGIVGCIAGFYSGSWIDELCLWVVGCIDCIPFYLFVAAIAFVVKTASIELGWPKLLLYGMHIAMIATFWTPTARYIRGEVIKLKHMEFVEAAHAIGVPKFQIMFRHIFPNTFHILLIQATIAFVGSIKSEVILSFLGLGVKDGISWGLMIAEASSEVPSGIYNNFLAASGFLFVLVMAFNIFADALQDALDPKKVQ